jgi:hypothetical protein
MTVEQLIEELKQFNPKTEVKIEGTDPTDWRYVNDVEDVRLGDDDSEMYTDEDYEVDEDGDPDYMEVKESSKVVLINGGSF